MEKGTYGQILTNVEKELQLNVLDAPDEPQINILSQDAANTKAQKPKPTCHHCKKLRQYTNQCPLLKKQNEQAEGTQDNPSIKHSDANNSVPNININNNNNKNNKEQ